MTRNDDWTRCSAKTNKCPKHCKGREPSDGTDSDKYIFMPGNWISILLSGQWKTGGLMELIIDSVRTIRIRLPPAQWSVMASMMISAIRSESSPHWLNSQITTTELIAAIEEKKVLEDINEGTIYKIINTIRNKIAKSGVSKLADYSQFTGMQYAHCLIRSSKSSGYRLALPPKLLRLIIGDKEYLANDRASEECDEGGR